MSSPSDNIASHLPDMARRQPNTMAVVFPEGRDREGCVAYTHFTYSQLDRRSDELAQGLAQVGITRGMRAVLMVTPSLDFFALTFALFKAGVVPVMVDPGMGTANLGQCLEEAEPEAFIGITKAHLARVVFRWGSKSCRKFVTVGPRLLWGGKRLDEVSAMGVEVMKSNGGVGVCIAPEPDEAAAILFTSGSTGVPKGVVYTHGIFQDQVTKLKEVYGIEPGDIDLPTFPLFALYAPGLGMTSIIPDMDFSSPGTVDPERIVEAIENFGVTNMFGSPALIRRLGFWGHKHGVKLPSLRRVISAGAPAREDSLRAFSSMLNEDTQIFTPYGATESLPVASIGSHQVLEKTAALTAQGKGVCVGQPVKGLDVKVISITDKPIENWTQAQVVNLGEIGEIVVKGANVTKGYFHRESSTRLAKIKDGEGLWHRMGDVGYFDGQGDLWFCGRKTHRVVCAGVTHFTIPVESIFNTHDDVFRTALVGVEVKGDMWPVICVEVNPKVSKSAHSRIRNELQVIGKKYPFAAPVRKFLFHPSFPVDIRHNSKIFREKLAVWAKGQI
ncbi:fatty acid CoA ligase family protein [Verrucomicrobia bacterium]|nr:fatty acid CoA ligase family protein [Verrucomicrobiota bacterium]